MRKDLTKPQLVSALKSGEIKIASASGLVINFVYKDGVKTGTLLTRTGSVRRFKNDLDAWHTLNNIYEESGMGRPY